MGRHQMEMQVEERDLGVFIHHRVYYYYILDIQVEHLV